MFTADKKNRTIGTFTPYLLDSVKTNCMQRLVQTEKVEQDGSERRVFTQSNAISGVDSLWSEIQPHYFMVMYMQYLCNFHSYKL